MIRGTTPTHIFNVPFSTSLIKELRISYAQDGLIVLEKTEATATLTDNTISVELTQEETLSFNDKKNIALQVKVLTTDGKVLATQIQQVRVDRCLSEEVLE